MSRYCIESSCNKRASFNTPDKRRGLYCVIHKLENMINIVSSVCISEKCRHQASFNYLHEKSGLLCTKHKLENMIDVVSKQCIESNCNIKPSFNYSNNKTGLYCNIHKLKDMINVVSKKCIEPNCPIKPCFNFSCEKTGIYCTSHKKDGMIDIFIKRCSHDKNNGCCIICFPNSKAFCKSCRLFRVRKSNDYLCNYCNPTTKLREKTKEMKLKGFLKKHYPVIHNKTVQISGSCYNNFPDFMIQLKDKLIIIECDENAHKNYPNDCEIIRMNNLQFSLKSNVIWIRFNPDKRNIPIKTKYLILKSYIEYYMNSNITNELVYLFY